MDKSITNRPDIEQKPIDEMGSLDDQFEDLIHAAAHSEAQRQRFALVIDATSSMGGVWSRAKDALKQAVDEIQSNTRTPFQVCVVAYRDHLVESASRVVEFSNWSDDTVYLKDFIENMTCFGGGDYPESIGHGLAYLLQQQGLSQIILIGDAPSKNGSLGYAEAQAFGQQSTPIYALYTDDDDRLVTCFKRLAQLSGGKAFPLFAGSNMSDILKTLFAHNKALQITYQATSIEGKRMQLELQK